MNKLLNVSSSPHVRSGLTTQSIMFKVVLSMMPVTVLGVINFGTPALKVILAAVIAAVVSEAIFNIIIKKPQTIGDGSAVVTGLMLALILPPDLPLYIPILGSVFAIVVAKCLFGGLGKNFMNPALAGRCCLLISYGAAVTVYKVDGVATATPLVALAQGQDVSIWSILVGSASGCIGSSTLGILIGAAMLFAFQLINLEIPVSIMVSFTAFMTLIGEQRFDLYEIFINIIGGGMLFGTFFMATDYVTSPVTHRGRMIYGTIIGILCGIFRVIGNAADSVSYAIIFGNLLVPLIEDYTIRLPFGHRVQKEKSEGFKIPKAAINLCVISLVAGIALSGVYSLTKDTIAAAQLAKEQESYYAVCQEAESFEEDEAGNAKIAELNGGIYGTTFGKAYINKMLVGKNAAGETVGYVISATTGDGFDGDIVMSIGFDLNGIVTGIEFTTITETSGMGLLVKEDKFKSQYVGDDVESYVMLKNGGAAAPNEIDGVSGATVSSTAVTNAVNAAKDFFAANMK